MRAKPVLNQKINMATKSGIPPALFVDDVDRFMASGEWGPNAEQALKKCDELYQKYRFMESNLMQKNLR
jgi:hypothetical protein